MTLSLILALGSNVTYLAGKFARIDLDPHRLLTAAVATTSLLFFGTLDAWNAIRYQDKIGNHNKDTKNDNKGPNDRANFVAAGMFFELVLSIAWLVVIVATKQFPEAPDAKGDLPLHT